MKPVVICSLAVLAVAVFTWAQSTTPAPTDPAQHEHGRKVFAGKCGKCHDEDARKKLADGSTLLTRLAASKDPNALLGTRLKSMNEEDRAGVVTYVDDLLAAFRASSARPAERH